MLRQIQRMGGMPITSETQRLEPPPESLKNDFVAPLQCPVASPSRNDNIGRSDGTSKPIVIVRADWIVN